MQRSLIGMACLFIVCDDTFLFLYYYFYDFISFFKDTSIWINLLYGNLKVEIKLGKNVWWSLLLSTSKNSTQIQVLHKYCHVIVNWNFIYFFYIRMERFFRHPVEPSHAVFEPFLVPHLRWSFGFVWPSGTLPPPPPCFLRNHWTQLFRMLPYISCGFGFGFG